MNDPVTVPDFELLSDATDSETLPCGFSEFGLAGLTAAEYLVERLELEAVGPLADAVLTWTDANDVDEVVAVSGVPAAHGPDDHRAFYVASPDYQAAHDLAAAEVAPMPGGYPDGVNGVITGRGIDSALRTCVFSTPAHAQTPDVEAALRQVGAVERVYGLAVDTGPPEAFAAEVSRHYEELAQQLRERQEEPGSRGEDRMYM